MTFKNSNGIALFEKVPFYHAQNSQPFTCTQFFIPIEGQVQISRSQIKQTFPFCGLDFILYLHRQKYMIDIWVNLSCFVLTKARPRICAERFNTFGNFVEKSS